MKKTTIEKAERRSGAVSTKKSVGIVRPARFFVFFSLTVAPFLAGCQTMNEDVENKRVWFPSLVQPGYLNPDHELKTAEGSDPFPTANVGPSSLQTRPQGWDVPRNWNNEVVGSREAVMTSTASATSPASQGTSSAASSSTFQP